MKLIDMITDIEHNFKEVKFSEADVEIITNEFNMDSYDINYDDFKVYEFYFGPWYCTDQYVGWSTIIFNKEVVAVAYQSARKSTQNIEWINKEGYNLVKEHLLSISNAQEENINYVSEKDLFSDFGKGYKVAYGSQILGKEVIYKDKLCKIIKTWEDYKDIDYWEYLNIELNTEDILTVKMKDILIPWKLKQEK